MTHLRTFCDRGCGGRDEWGSGGCRGGDDYDEDHGSGDGRCFAKNGMLWVLAYLIYETGMDRYGYILMMYRYDRALWTSREEKIRVTHLNCKW